MLGERCGRDGVSQQPAGLVNGENRPVWVGVGGGVGLVDLAAMSWVQRGAPVADTGNDPVLGGSCGLTSAPLPPSVNVRPDDLDKKRETEDDVLDVLFALDVLVAAVAVESGIVVG